MSWQGIFSAQCTMSWKGIINIKHTGHDNAALGFVTQVLPMQLCTGLDNARLTSPTFVSWYERIKVYHASLDNAVSKLNTHRLAKRG